MRRWLSLRLPRLCGFALKHRSPAMWDYGADEFFSAPFHAAFHNNLEVQSIEFFFELLQIVENCGRTMSLLRSRSGFAFSEKKTHFPVEKKNTVYAILSRFL